MKSLFLALGLFVSTFAHAHPALLTLSSDKATYSEGESAVLRAYISTKPDNTSLEFELLGTLNAAPLAIDRITDYQRFSTVTNLSVGSYVWSVDVYVQDARYARDLKSSITFFTSEIERLTDAIAEETDPEKLENLQKQKAKNEALLAAAESELISIRTHVAGPFTLNFNAL